MEILGDKRVKRFFLKQFKILSRKNIYIKNIVCKLKKENVIIYIKNEEDLLNDTYNRTKTLTQYRSYHLNEINLFYTRYETLESLMWLLLHELCHYILKSNALTENFILMLNAQHFKSSNLINNYTDYYYNQIEDYEQKSTEDVIHESIPEELICNQFATGIMGRSYDR